MKLYKIILSIILAVVLWPMTGEAQQHGGAYYHGPNGGGAIYYHGGGGHYYGGGYRGIPPSWYPRYAPNRYPGSYHPGGVVIPRGSYYGTYGSFGFVYNQTRYVPPPVYVAPTAPPVVYPVAPQEIIEIPKDAVIIVGDRVITNQNGRIVVYKAAQQ